MDIVPCTLFLFWLFVYKVSDRKKIKRWSYFSILWDGLVCKLVDKISYLGLSAFRYWGLQYCRNALQFESSCHCWSWWTGSLHVNFDIKLLFLFVLLLGKYAVSQLAFFYGSNQAIHFPFVLSASSISPSSLFVQYYYWVSSPRTELLDFGPCCSLE